MEDRIKILLQLIFNGYCPGISSNGTVSISSSGGKVRRFTSIKSKKYFTILTTVSYKVFYSERRADYFFT